MGAAGWYVQLTPSFGMVRVNFLSIGVAALVVLHVDKGGQDVFGTGRQDSQSPKQGLEVEVSTRCYFSDGTF